MLKCVVLNKDWIKMQVNLTKKQLKCLLKGSDFGYEISSKFEEMGLGMLRSGMGGETWQWNWKALEDLNEEELWKIINLIKW